MSLEGARSLGQRASGALRGLAEAQLLISLIVLFGLFAVLYPGMFFSMQNMTEMSRVLAILFVVSLGQSFALIVGGLDISVASTMGFTSVVTALSLATGHSIAASAGLGLVAGSTVGLLNGLLIAQLGVTPFVATLGMMTFLAGLANQLSGGNSIAPLPAGFALLGRGDWGPLPATVGIALVVMLGAWILLERSRVGLYLFAIGGNREAARIAGVAVAFYQVLAYTLCGFCAAVAGIMLTSRVAVGQASLGQGYDLLSVATAVIGGVAITGGRGKVSGVLTGAVLLTVLTTGLDMGHISAFAQQMMTGAVLIGAVLMAGLQGRGLGRMGRGRV